MEKRAAPSPGAPSQAVDDYWSELTDDELRQVVWITTDPMGLENIQPTIPDDLAGFKIEVAYDLDPSDPPVPCAHCPQHQRHRHGFVLKADDGRRYLLGSHCGPKAYASDYWVASVARNRAKRRAEALLSWDRLRGQIPDALAALADEARGSGYAAVRRFRGAWEGEAPRVLSFLRSRPTDSLTGAPVMKVSKTFQDHEAEARREALFMEEVPKLAHLPNKAHAQAIAELRQRIGKGEIWRTEERDFGVLRGADWLLGEENPFKTLEDVTRRLRGYHVAGATTQDKTVARLDQFNRETRKDLDRALDLLRRIATAETFFAGEQMTRLAEWAAIAMDQIGTITVSGRSFRIADRRRAEIVLPFPADWSPPGVNLAASLGR